VLQALPWLIQVLAQLKAEGEIKVLDDVIRIAPQLLGLIMKMTDVDIPANSKISAQATLKLGVGIAGGICLGWADTKGFHMVGARGHMAAAASVGADIVAGLHHTRKYVKAILGITNVCIEIVFELPGPAKTGTEGGVNEVTSPALLRSMSLVEEPTEGEERGRDGREKVENYLEEYEGAWHGKLIAAKPAEGGHAPGTRVTCTGGGAGKEGRIRDTMSPALSPASTL
jgi:hypothetical protein